MSGPFKYRAFISYSHEDRAWAQWLHQRLERYRVPSRLIGAAGAHGQVPSRIGRCFRDQAELTASSDLGDRLQQALRDSQVLIVVCSPRSAKSRWVGEEIRFFRSIGRGDSIYALIVDGKPHADDQAQECFPAALRIREDGEPFHPLAADARSGHDGKDDGFLKLAAGVLGVNFDDLRQRELRRRTRAAGLAVGVSLGIAGVTSLLAISAYHARNEAQSQQHRAEEREAQLKQVVAFQAGMLQRVDVYRIGAGWVERMRAHIGDALRSDTRMTQGQISTDLAEFDRLRPLANASDLARETLGQFLLAPEDKEIGDRFKNDPATEASLRLSLGKSYVALGLPREAHQQFDRVVGLLGRELSSNDRLLAQARMARGDVEVTDGDGKTGLAELRAVSEALHRSAGDSDPDTIMADIQLINGLAHTGDYAGAETLAAQVAPRANAALGADDPLTLLAEHALASSLRLQSHYGDAEVILKKVLAARERILGPEADDTINTLSQLGNVQLALGENEAALATERRVVEICARTKGAGHPLTLLLQSDLANALAAMNDFAAAGAIEEEVLTMQRDQLGDEHPETVRTMLNHGSTLISQRDFAGASGLLRKVVDIRTRRLGADNPRTLYAMTSLSEALRGAGDNKGSLEVAQNAYDGLVRSVGESDERTLEAESNLSTTLFRLGRGDEARRHGLHAIAGYRRIVGDQQGSTQVALHAFAQGLCDSGHERELIPIDGSSGRPASDYCDKKKPAAAAK